VKDLEHVSGFKSHGFRKDVETNYQPSNWEVQHVDLVGILQYEKPVVYLTQGMPSMDQVRQGKTRQLDYFEETALPTLCEGEDLFVANKDNTIRMLGAIRATKVCLQCHDAKVGDLLGAFSYTLRAAPNK
jgi:bisphosphoglycerate-dependent phosphoglycerate mutase